MKIARTRALVARLLTNHSHKTHQQHSEGFCGLQSVSQSVQGTRSQAGSLPHIWKISSLASCRLIRHMDAERSRLARPYMRALGPSSLVFFSWFRIACSSRPG